MSFFEYLFVNPAETPLTVLKTLAPTLRQLIHLPPSIWMEIIETIEQNLGRLELLANDMLESARLEGGMIALYQSSSSPSTMPNWTKCGVWSSAPMTTSPNPLAI